VVCLYLLFAFAGGAALPFQAGVMLQLAGWLDQPAAPPYPPGG
jgi:uncharacterized membrane protein YdcZ (DUF606 family)